MTTSIDQVRALLIDCFDTSGLGVVGRARAGEILGAEMQSHAALKAAAAIRPLAAQLGRWPLVVCAWNDSGTGLDRFGDLVARQSFTHEPLSQRGKHEVEDILAAAMDASVLDSLDVISNRFDEFEFDLPNEIESTIARFGRGPDVGVLSMQLGPNAGFREVERALLEWELNEFGPEALPPPFAGDAHMHWFEPAGRPVALLLLPTSVSWHVPAYVSWYAADEASSELVCALFRKWEERYGARPVCHYLTMVGFEVDRPPTEIREALELAIEHYLIAQCTMTLPGVSIRDHARTLMGNSRWFLHQRP